MGYRQGAIRAPDAPGRRALPTTKGSGSTVGSTEELGGVAGAVRLGFTGGHVVQEFGYGDDVDQELRSAIEELIGGELADEDYDDVTDGVILWWRDDDGDLTDALVDVRASLDDGGQIWLLTRKPGRDGHVDHGDIEEAATTAGLHATSTLSIAPDWSATHLDTRSRR